MPARPSTRTKRTYSSGAPTGAPLFLVKKRRERRPRRSVVGGAQAPVTHCRLWRQGRRRRRPLRIHLVSSYPSTDYRCHCEPQRGVAISRYAGTIRWQKKMCSDPPWSVTIGFTRRFPRSLRSLGMTGSGDCAFVLPGWLSNVVGRSKPLPYIFPPCGGGTLGTAFPTGAFDFSAHIHRLPLSLRAPTGRGNLPIRRNDTVAEEDVLRSPMVGYDRFHQEIPTVASLPRNDRFGGLCVYFAWEISKVGRWGQTAPYKIFSEFHTQSGS